MDASLDELLELEHAGWRSLCDGTGSGFYGRTMTEEGRMVLATGITMTRSEVVESLSSAPTWDDHCIEDAVLVEISDTVASLVYVGTAHRGDEDFSAVMTSTYVRAVDGWRLAVYQQTPMS